MKKEDVITCLSCKSELSRNDLVTSMKVKYINS